MLFRSRLEGSKVFAKEVMSKYNVPTAGYEVFQDSQKAKDYIAKKGAPVVIKADGLAAGKGVIVAQTIEEALKAIDDIMEDKVFGAAGEKVLIEDCLAGEEASILVVSDGENIVPLASSQDYKRANDGDQGPNTGGMGAYSPAPVITEELLAIIIETIINPVIKGLKQEGKIYKGILYAGLMITSQGPKVIEFNVRFGDPETQVILPRLKSDLIDVFSAAIDGSLDQVKLNWDSRACICVVMASEGYPGSYEKGRPMRGLDNDFGPDVVVFHAGTARKDGQLVNAGGRVLGVTARAVCLEDAIKAAYEAVAKISWQGCFYRHDIGQKALRRLSESSAVVGVVLGSDSDLPVFKGCLDFFREMDIAFEIIVASAHRSPERAADYARNAGARGLKVLIAGAGMAAHLAGVLAAHTTLPVIGVPVDNSSLNGLDSLLSTVQMPPGVPVATMGIGASGARNAAILTAQILAVADTAMAAKLLDFKRQMAAAVARKSEALVREQQV